MDHSEGWGLAQVAPAVLGGGQVIVPFVMRRLCRGHVAFQPRLMHRDGRLSVLPAVDSLACAERHAQHAAIARMLALPDQVAPGLPTSERRTAAAGPCFWVSAPPLEHCIIPVAARYPQGWRGELEVLATGNSQPLIIELGDCLSGQNAVRQAMDTALEAALLWQAPDSCDDAELLILIQHKLVLTAIVELADWAASLSPYGFDRLLALYQLPFAAGLAKHSPPNAELRATLKPSPFGSPRQRLLHGGAVANAALAALQLRIASHIDKVPDPSWRFSPAHIASGAPVPHRAAPVD